jgi:hypothetical protein
MTEIANRRRGRPAHKKDVLSSWVSKHQSFTMGQLMRDMNWPLQDANNVIQRALASGQLEPGGSILQPGCKRPVTVYQQPGLRSAAMPLQEVLRVWS